MALLAVHVLEDLPKGEGSTPNLPSVTNVVTELMKEGWPKEAAA